MTTDATGSPAKDRVRVFISYNRADREWAEWIAGVLDSAGYAPFLQAWHILPGMNFGVEMHKAAAESGFTIAVLSESFLKSEFTLPEWVAAFVSDPTGRKRKLIPVRVAPCDPPGLLKALVYIDVVGLDETAAHKALLDGLKPTGRPVGPIRFPGQPSSALASSAPFPPSLARLHFVPELPPHFLLRPDAVAGVKRHVLGDGAARVAITGRGQAVGVQGMGGIGKSVLAAALAREADIRKAFPDGVVWLTVGQQPSLIELQGRLLKVVTGSIPVAATVHECADAIREALDGRRVLLILDDVWEPAHAELFRGIPEGCRLLVTTRNLEVLTGLEATEFKVDLLNEEESLRLLADWSGLKPEALPAEAQKIVSECGQLPLALAAIGAMVRLGPTAWKDALARLRRADLDKVRKSFPDYPYPHLLRALEVSVEALPSDDRERYLDLAVFPEEIAIPEGPLRLLWNLDDLDTRDTMRRLAARSLATWKEDSTGRADLTLHDLQRDLISRQRAKELPALHERLLNGYAAICQEGTDVVSHGGDAGPRTAGRTPDEPVNWARGPKDGYFFHRLPYHLKEAARRGELRRVLLDFDWLQAKLEAADVVGLIADYDLVTGEEELALVQGAIRLSAHAVGPDKHQLASQLVGRLSDQTMPQIQQLMSSACAWRCAPWLRPLNGNLWPPGTALLRTLTGHSGPVAAVALSADGRRAVSGSDDKTLKVWDLESGRELWTLEGHAGRINAVALAGDGRRAVSGSDDKTLKVWDLESGRELRTLKGHSGRIKAVALSADGRRAGSGADDGTLKLWDLGSGRELQTIKDTGGVEAVVLSKDGRRAVWESMDHTMKVRDLEGGRDLRVVGSHASLVRSMPLLWAAAFSADGRRAVSASGQTPKVTDLDSGRELQTLQGDASFIGAVGLNADGRRAVSACLDNTLTVWDLRSGRPLRTLQGHAERVTALALSANGRWAVSGSTDHTVKVWDLERGRELQVMKGHLWAVRSVALGTAGQRAVSGSFDQTLKVWEPQSGRELLTLRGHAGRVYAVALSADGRRAVSGASDETLRSWELESGRELRTLQGHANVVTAVALSADGRRALSGSYDATLKLWDLESGRELRTLQGHVNVVDAVALSADGRRALSGSYDATLKLWDLESGRELRTLVGHAGGVYAAALSSDGRRAVSGSHDATLKLWDLESGEILATFTGESTILAAALALDGRTIVAGEESGRIHFLRLVLPEDPVEEGAG